MVIRLADLAKLPDALQAELENRSQMKAEALAHKIANKIGTRPLPANPYWFNPYLDESQEPTGNSYSDSSATKSNSKNWGGNGW
jgi:hypothetical protein